MKIRYIRGLTGEERSLRSSWEVSGLENKFRSTFDKIYAEEELKEKTADFLSKEIRRRKPAGRIFRQRLIGACAAFAVFLFISGLSYFTPNAYVDMDVNPSISLTLNRYGRVLEAWPRIMMTARLSCGMWMSGISPGIRPWNGCWMK